MMKEACLHCHRRYIKPLLRKRHLCRLCIYGIIYLYLHVDGNDDYTNVPVLQCIERESMSTTTLNMYTVAATIPLTMPTNTISFPIAYIIAVYREHTYETSFRDQSTGTKEKGPKKSKVKHSTKVLLTFDFSPPSRKLAKTEPCHRGETHTV